MVSLCTCTYAGIYRTYVHVRFKLPSFPHQPSRVPRWLQGLLRFHRWHVLGARGGRSERRTTKVKTQKTKLFAIACLYALKTRGLNRSDTCKFSSGDSRSQIDLQNFTPNVVTPQPLEKYIYTYLCRYFAYFYRSHVRCLKRRFIP